MTWAYEGWRDCGASAAVAQGCIYNDTFCEVQRSQTRLLRLLQVLALCCRLRIPGTRPCARGKRDPPAVLRPGLGRAPSADRSRNDTSMWQHSSCRCSSGCWSWRNVCSLIDAAAAGDGDAADTGGVSASRTASLMRAFAQLVCGYGTDNTLPPCPESRSGSTRTTQIQFKCVGLTVCIVPGCRRSG